MIALLIAFVTVSFQTIRAARANPVESLGMNKIKIGDYDVKKLFKSSIQKFNKI